VWVHAIARRLAALKSPKIQIDHGSGTGSNTSRNEEYGMIESVGGGAESLPVDRDSDRPVTTWRPDRSSLYPCDHARSHVGDARMSTLCGCGFNDQSIDG
jgi:hypothetical protein